MNQLVIFSCSQVEKGLIEKFSNSNVKVGIGSILESTANEPWGVYVEGGNLEALNSKDFFNTSYFWLIRGFENVNDNIIDIRIDSQLTVLENNTLWDVWSYGRRINIQVQKFPYANVGVNGSICLFKKLLPTYHKEYRGNFHQQKLRVAIYLNPRLRERDIKFYDDFFTGPNSTQVIGINKLMHTMGMLLRYKYNFS